jgi:hypothetical protein
LGDLRGTPIANLLCMLGLFRKSLVIWLAALGLGGCGSNDEFTTDVAGVYTVAVTNGASSCSFDWEEGKQTTNIGLTITQDAQKIHGTIDGLTGAVFTLLLGSADFDGTIKGNVLTLTDYGQRTTQEGNCCYTYNATVKATQTGDTISGTITYATKTNGNPDCAAIECSATQKFNGTRPPT